MALLSKAQEAALTERVQKREQLKREHLKVQELDVSFAVSTFLVCLLQH
jgi:hypothetical protein